MIVSKLLNKHEKNFCHDICVIFVIVKIRRQILKHIALLMAILMFSSSAGLAVDYHYCQGDLQNVSFYTKAKNCHDYVKSELGKKVKKACHKEPANELSSAHKDNCCDNEAVFMQLDTEFGIIAIPNFNDYTDVEFLLSPSLNLDFIPFSYYDAKDYKYYKPPSVELDHIVLFQSFLI